MKGKEAKREKTVEIDLNKLIAVALVIIAAVLSVLCVVKTVKSFMRVKEFEVTGYSSYEREEIITASGIKPKDRLYSIDKKEVAERIIRECPYISKADIELVFPNTVRIDVECYAAAWYVEIEGDFYSLDSNMRVLEETVNEQKYINGMVTKLTLPNIKSAVVGSELTFGNDDAEREFTYDFMKKINAMSFKTRLSLVDIDNRFDINIGVDGNIDVYLGNGSDMEDKLRAVEQALASEKLRNCISAEIYAADPSSVFIKPVYDYGVTDEGQTTENEP